MKFFVNNMKKGELLNEFLNKQQYEENEILFQHEKSLNIDQIQNIKEINLESLVYIEKLEKDKNIIEKKYQKSLDTISKLENDLQCKEHLKSLKEITEEQLFEYLKDIDSLKSTIDDYTNAIFKKENILEQESFFKGK